ncbi:MAG: MarR family transcriptional regulator [Actinomycetota bacterium]
MTAEQDRVARLRLAMARLARQQRRSFPTGLTPSQISALITIDHHGPVRLSDLARLEAVAPPTVTRIVAKLEADGLVERQSDDNDRRIARVTITDEGHRRIDETRAARNEWFGRKLAALDPADLAAILEAIEPLERLAATNPVER